MHNIIGNPYLYYFEKKKKNYSCFFYIYINMAIKHSRNGHSMVLIRSLFYTKVLHVLNNTPQIYF